MRSNDTSVFVRTPHSLLAVWLPECWGLASPTHMGAGAPDRRTRRKVDRTWFPMLSRTKDSASSWLSLPLSLDVRTLVFGIQTPRTMGGSPSHVDGARASAIGSTNFLTRKCATLEGSHPAPKQGLPGQKPSGRLVLQPDSCTQPLPGS